MKNLIKKIEEVAQEKIFIEADENVVSKFLGGIENEFNFIKIPEDLKELFIKDYNRLVRWIRKNLPRQEYEKMGYKYKDYMSDGIRIYEEMGYKYSG